MSDLPPMPTIAIAVFNKTSGELLHIGPLGSAPASAGTIPLPAGYDQATWAWNAATRTMVEDPARTERQLVAEAKAEGERRRMLVLSPGGSKKSVYALKQAEVEVWNDLGNTVAVALSAFLALPAAKQKRRFRFAMAEAAARGEANPAAAIARFAAGADASNTEAARIEAIEQKAVAAIKAATSATAKRAAATAINWNWQPA